MRLRSHLQPRVDTHLKRPSTSAIPTPCNRRRLSTISPIWSPPEVSSRPLALLGAGTLGRRIACAFAAAGHTVHIRDPSKDARTDALDYINKNIDNYATLSKPTKQAGKYLAFPDIDAAVHDAWTVIEAIPEKLPLKIDAMGELDKKTPADCILASNSSSFKSRHMLDKVSPQRRPLVCNTHFLSPPQYRAVELMTSGETNPDIFPFLSRVLEGCGLLPVTVRKESTGFVFNRLWAAIKREVLMTLAEGVSDPKEIDNLWVEMVKKSPGPCAMMDHVELDIVALVEETYVKERQLDSSMTVDWLRHNHIDKGRLGMKSSKGGLYSPPAQKKSQTPAVYFLDVGLGANVKDIATTGQHGRICRRVDGRVTTVISGLEHPDGIAVSQSAGRIFWTSMGASVSSRDGSVMSAALDGTDIQTIIPKGSTYTPKQLTLDESTQQLYFSDREGLSVHRCDFTGANHTMIIQRGDPSTADKDDWTRRCVGVALDKPHGKIYWSQKGAGAIYRANISMTAGETALNRSDIETVVQGLPEPIDLAIDPEARMLYWTDRGEYPRGKSLNRAWIGEARGEVKGEILARQLHDPIGLAIDSVNGHVYSADMGGCLYRFDMDGGRKTVLHCDDGAYTGVTLVSEL